MLFEYKAINSEGHVISGEKEGNDSPTVTGILKTEGLIVISIEPKKKSFKKRFNLSFFAFKTYEKIAFARNISSMLDAGLALSRSLEVLSRQAKNPKTKEIIDDINQKIKDGMAVSVALESHPKIFNTLFVSMTRAGEESGNLVESFRNIANQLEKNYLLAKKVKGAMVYPGVIIVAMSLVGFFMMTYIVPTLSKTFKELNVELPQTTQAVIALSDFFQTQTVAFFGIVIAGIVLSVLFLKSKSGRKSLDIALTKAPLFGELTKQINSARTARTLSSLLKAGVPYLQSVQITKQVITNHLFKNVLEKQKKK